MELVRGARPDGAQAPEEVAGPAAASGGKQARAVSSVPKHLSLHNPNPGPYYSGRRGMLHSRRKAESWEHCMRKVIREREESPNQGEERKEAESATSIASLPRPPLPCLWSAFLPLRLTWAVHARSCTLPSHTRYLRSAGYLEHNPKTETTTVRQKF